MRGLTFFHPIEVRYGDLDPQGHVNNARYLTYLEQVRIAYFRKLGLWNGGSWLDIGVIVADAHIAFKAPIQFGQALRIRCGVTRLGNKSFTFEYLFEDGDTGQELAQASTVLVSYDYHTQQSTPIPDDWRAAIHEFEGI